jgi:DNA modification methylase
MSDLRLGDCLNVMRGMADDSVDAIVTDPPGGIHFLGKSWDHNKGSRDAWICWLAIRLSESLRIAKPGTRALVWAIPRTSHWTGMAIEDAGWIVEDRISHIFGQGFPKAKSKLKPACEDWWLARKASKNVPPLNIDACRIGWDESSLAKDSRRRQQARTDITGNHWGKASGGQVAGGYIGNTESPSGRWPANFALTCCGEMPHLEGCPVAILDEQSGKTGAHSPSSGPISRPDLQDWRFNRHEAFTYGDSGCASRFFYCSKASPKDRGKGNTHPTVKSTELLSWLIRLISDPGDTILDPFAGSGTTGLACLNTGRHFIGIESDPVYFAIAERRLAAASNQTPLFAG